MLGYNVFNNGVVLASSPVDFLFGVGVGYNLKGAKMGNNSPSTTKKKEKRIVRRK
jgi:hypothetical protein